jgi:pimeloyl-ACP methyl ester carboxylesterase
VRLQVRDFGPRDALVLVMLHGFSAILNTWEPGARTLENGYRVVRFDLPR